MKEKIKSLLDLLVEEKLKAEAAYRGDSDYRNGFIDSKITVLEDVIKQLLEIIDKQ